jgi:hypothetical protein
VRTLWLADHLLVTKRGHHVSYNGFIADSARRAGLEARILCARECEAQVAGGFATRGIFRRDLRNTPSPLLSRSRLALDVLETVARRRFEADLRRGITPGEIKPEDIIFAEKLAPRNLAGWLRWFEAFPKGLEPTLRSTETVTQEAVDDRCIVVTELSGPLITFCRRLSRSRK